LHWCASPPARTATQRNLPALIDAGSFRSDLYYRINVFPIEVPALRERKDDIRLLVGYFIDRYSTKSGKKFLRINKKSMDSLESYPWPGNIRELQNVIERSVIVCDSDEFSVDESWLSGAPKSARPLTDDLWARKERGSKPPLATAEDECQGLQAQLSH